MFRGRNQYPNSNSMKKKKSIIFSRIGGRKDINRQALVIIKTSNGLGSKSGESKCHTKWHASPGLNVF